MKPEEAMGWIDCLEEVSKVAIPVMLVITALYGLMTGSIAKEECFWLFGTGGSMLGLRTVNVKSQEPKALNRKALTPPKDKTNVDPR